MRRTQIYLTEEEWRRLSTLGRQKRLSKALLIREAVDQVYQVRPSAEAFSKALWGAFGIWRGRHEMRDVAAYLQSLRQGSSRERYLKKRWRKPS